MRLHSALKVLVLLSLASAFLGPLSGSHGPVVANAAPTARLQVWNDIYGSNITSLTSLNPGATFTAKVNVTDGGPISGFDITLNYNITLGPNVIYAVTPQPTDPLSGGLFDPNNPPAGCSIIVVRHEVFPGRPIRYAAVVQGGCTVPGSGTLFTITFQVSGVGATSLDIVQTSTTGRPFCTIVGSSPDFPCIQYNLFNAYFRNSPGIPPVAKFAFTPISPILGDAIQFNATQSYDPDNSTMVGKGIKKYLWDFGDGTALASGNFTSHVLSLSPTVPATGTFSVKLVVFDTDDGLPAEQILLVTVRPTAIHDIAVSLSLGKSQLVQGETQTVMVKVSNHGTQDEVANLLVTYDFQGATTIANETRFAVPLTAGATFNYILQTGGLLPRVYTVTASASMLNVTSNPPTIIPDNYPIDNTAFESFNLQRPSFAHNVAVAQIYVAPTRVIAGQPIFIGVYLANLGNQTENVSLAVYYDSHLVENNTGIVLNAEPYPESTVIIWDTTEVIPGNYTISATVFLATDQNTADNTLVDGRVTILPPPVLVLTPSTGTLGAKVLLQASGLPQAPNGYSTEVLVTFDDQLLGFAFFRNGSFNFTFDVPNAQPGLHLVKVQDPSDRLTVTAPFQVLSSPAGPGRLDLTVDTGPIYFPRDTIVFYILTRSNGSPVTPDSLQLTLIKPDGTMVTLQPVSVDIGVFKATYAVPGTGSVGTYALLANAQKKGLADGSSLVGFEVKPDWINGQGPRIASALSIFGVIAGVAVAWQKGYLGRRRRE